jgi:uncharacterized protein (DUF2141 family)
MKLIKQTLVIIVFIIINSCAKQSTPMGGAKDEKPPVLLSVLPVDQSTQIKPKTIELIFNEYVKIENATKQIIITPKINKDEMVTTVNKNKITIKLNQELEDNTTYVFNFQKSIKDITENNSAENIKLVFSTGDKIDSLVVSGKVSTTFLTNEKLMKDVMIGLYTLEDTTNVLNASPYYITQSDSIGNFKLENIRPGKYKIYAWQDLNNSLKAEEKTEPYAFLNDTLTINQNIDNVLLYLTKADISPFRINRTGTIGNQYEISLSKYPLDINIQHDQLNEKIFYRQRDKVLRFYHLESPTDSTAMKISFKDSVGYSLDTTLYAKFLPSDRAKEKLEVQIQGNKNFVQRIEANFIFNKPVTKINYDSLFVSFDTTSRIPITPDLLFLKDSSNYTSLSMMLIVPDSISKENFKLIAGTNTFIDIEDLSNDKKIEFTFRKLKPETLVTALKGKVNTKENPLLIQLMRKEEVIREIYLENSNEFIFRNLEPGTYQLRAIVDQNRNKRWDTSNLNFKRYQEKVYYKKSNNLENPYDILLKAGWENEVEIDIVPEQGIQKP